MTPPAYNVDARRSRRRHAGAGVALAVLFGLTVAGVAHVGVQSRRVEIGRALGDASRRHATLLEEQRRLRLEVAEWKSPARLVGAARSAGMAPVSPALVHALPPDRASP